MSRLRRQLLLSDCERVKHQEPLRRLVLRGHLQRHHEATHDRSRQPHLEQQVEISTEHLLRMDLFLGCLAACLPGPQVQYLLTAISIVHQSMSELLTSTINAQRVVTVGRTGLLSHLETLCDEDLDRRLGTAAEIALLSHDCLGQKLVDGKAVTDHRHESQLTREMLAIPGVLDLPGTAEMSVIAATATRGDMSLRSTVLHPVILATVV